MKKLWLLLILCAALAACAFADEITFSFINGAPGSLTASAAGLTAGVAMNIVVSDATTGAEFPLLGTFTASTGPSSSFTVTPPLVQAEYTAGGLKSVLIVDQFNNLLVAGRMDDHGAFLTGFPDGRGAFLGAFDVSFVSPAVLGLFGLGPQVLPTGSVSATFANDNFDGTTVTGELGGGTVTVETPVAEGSTWMLMLTGVTLAGVARTRCFS
jgi:hypothetical protein